MSEKATLTGFIRLVPVDTIGIPVFVAAQGNSMFVPETDGDLRISKFCEFYNEDGYRIDFQLPSDFIDKSFALRDSVPIPFWINNAPFVIVGDADKDEPEKLFGTLAHSNSVLKDISRLLDDARSGRLRDRMEEWEAQSIAASFSDVFYKTPVRSRYWVSRYRAAVAEARKLTQPPHPVDVKLRQVATEWLRLFGSKADLRRVIGLLGNPSNGIFSRRQFADILFAFLISKYSAGVTNDIDVYVSESALHVFLPEGLYGHFLANGWPQVPFNYNKEGSFIGIALDELSNAHRTQYHARAAKLVFLLFGRAALPNQVDELARVYLYNAGKTFGALRDRWDMADYENFDERLDDAREMLAVYDQMLELDSLINGKERLRVKSPNGRFGVPAAFIRTLQSVVLQSET